jgi:DNA-binding LytR/AlgR family response regulator
MEIMPQFKALLSKSSEIAIKVNRRILFIDSTEVIAAEADGNYILLQRPSGSDLMRESLSAPAEKLRPHGFIRIHRWVLVNASCVLEIQPWTTGGCLLRTKGGKEYTVLRTYSEICGVLCRSGSGASRTS